MIEHAHKLVKHRGSDTGRKLQPIIVIDQIIENLTDLSVLLREHFL